jgi:hypothetical protein
VRGALTPAHTPDGVVELFIHLIPYLGVPRMVAAMACAERCCAKRPLVNAAELPELHFDDRFFPAIRTAPPRPLLLRVRRAARVPELGTVIFLRYAE